MGYGSFEEFPQASRLVLPVVGFGTVEAHAKVNPQGQLDLLLEEGDQARLPLGRAEVRNESFAERCPIVGEIGGGEDEHRIAALLDCPFVFIDLRPAECKLVCGDNLRSRYIQRRQQVTTDPGAVRLRIRYKEIILEGVGHIHLVAIILFFALVPKCFASRNSEVKFCFCLLARVSLIHENPGALLRIASSAARRSGRRPLGY